MAGASGLLRNCSGSWVSGFSLNVGIASNNIAKLGANCQGLILAGDLDFKFIYLEIDSMTVLSYLTTTNDLSLDVILLISDCKNLMARVDRLAASRIP